MGMHSNYGGILQNYALQTVLKRMGHSVTTFDKKPKPDLTFSQKLKRYPKRIIDKYLLRKRVQIRQERKLYEIAEMRSRYTLEFVSDRIDVTYLKSLKSVDLPNLDCIVIGSDQVWRASYFSETDWLTSRITDAFGAFAERSGVGIFSYAASFGHDDLSAYKKSDIRRIKKLIKNFRGVSVRETGGVGLCRDNFGCEAVQVLDPTMLLDREDYCKLIPETEKKRQGIATYILDKTEGKTAIIAEVSKAAGLPEYSLEAKWSGPADPVESWLAGFRDASLVITDSFHGCVFSIIFGKPFIVMKNPKRGNSRFDTLAETLGIGSHFVDENEPFRFTGIEEYAIEDSTYEKLRGMREKSMEFLRGCLED